MKPLVLIIDDEEKPRTLLSRIIGLEGFDVLEAGNGKSGLKKLEQQEVTVVLCDVKLPDANGVELAGKIKTEYPLTELILLTAYGNIPDGVQAIKNGAFDYITKGDDQHRIIPLLHRAIEKALLSRKVWQLEQQVGKKYSFENIIGNSKSLLQAIELARKVAQSDTTVLLLGETGTGKEVFAQAIHRHSPRKTGPFVAINCSSFNKELLESELFGHKAGAFTGAHKDKKGLFEEAHNGTLFLDELGEMPFELQARLLRVLETGECTRLGDTKPYKVDVRLISATNCNLDEKVKQGQFRQDLFYRVSVFQIVLPPLRERVNDIPMLAEYFTDVFASKMGRKSLEIPAEYSEALKQYQWPGNIRELKNVLERSVILCERDILQTDSLPQEVTRVILSPRTTQGTLSAFDLASAEKLHIQKVMNYANGNKTEAARLLNIAITTLYRKLEEYKIGS